MATIYRCDRCHQDFSEPDRLQEVRIPKTIGFSSFLHVANVAEYRFDLCGLCCEELLRVVNTSPKPTLLAKALAPETETA